MAKPLVGAFSDTAILAIGRYLMKLELFYSERKKEINLDNEIDFLLEKFKLVKKDNEKEFKTDILNAYKFVKEKKTVSINAIEYTKFTLNLKIGNLSLEKIEQDLIAELNFC